MSKPTTLRLYVSSNLDGILVCPERIVPDTTIRVPDSARRVFVAGDPSIRNLNPDQLNAIVELAFRDPKIREGRNQAIFYGPPTKDRVYEVGFDDYVIVLTHTWTHMPKKVVKPITPAEVIARQSQPPPELLEAINDMLIGSPTPLDMQVETTMILNYYAIKCNGLVYANYQTLEGAQKGLVERARYLQEKQRVCIENVTSRSFDADWYGGHANWKIVEVTLELLD